jgi:GINS complex subunit 2
MSGVQGLTNSHLEFLSEDTPIEISPKFNLAQLNLIEGDLGPFQASVPITVPLWLALSLRKRSMCTILAPAWFTLEELEKVLRAEKEGHEFQPLPFHYMEIASQLLNCAWDDMEQPHKLQSIIEDIWLTRAEKRRKGLDGLDLTNLFAVKMNNVSALEINHFRQTALLALEQIHTILAAQEGRVGEAAGVSSDSAYSQSQSSQSAADPADPPRKLRRH